ncbi:MAG: hypothetical protein MI865_02350 [Proteobacteria bacterium]|nr:hypothetical protein [Pseudomonadota bacterium]
MLTDSEQAVFPKLTVLISISAILILIVSVTTFVLYSDKQSILTDLNKDFPFVTDKNKSVNQINTTEENKVRYTINSSSGFKQLSPVDPAFQIDNLNTYSISVGDNTDYTITVAHYKDARGENKNAIVYLPAARDDENNTTDGSDKTSDFRYQKWLNATNVIKKHTSDQALFVSFWDNAQRIHLFTGREVWSSMPDRNAYITKEEQVMWESIAGGFDTEGKLKKYSQYLLMDVDVAIAGLRKELSKDRDTYILVSSDDLAHIQEIAYLTGQGLPLETRLFPTDGDLHNSISKVKEWAKEGNGTGSYLVQPVSEKFNRVWRITDKAFENSLFVRLLPFTSSLDKSFDNIKLVYQSDWGAYLSIYQFSN